MSPKKTISIFLLLFVLSGCALVGISSDDPELQNASSEARQALDRARNNNVDNNYQQEFRRLSRQFERLERRKQEDPSRDLIAEYENVRNQLGDLTIRTLRDRIRKRQQRINQLEDRVRNLRSRISNLTESRDEAQQNVSKIKERLEETKSVLRKKNEQLRQIEKRVNKISNQHSQLINKVSQLNNEKKRAVNKLDELRRRTETLRNQLKKKQQKLRQLKKQNNEITNNLNRDLNQGDVQKSDKKVTIVLGTKILFGLGKVELRNQARSTLREVSQELRNHPEREIRVEGHTDDLPLQNELKEKYDSNWELSAKRAVVVLKYLVRNENISADRIGAVAYGKTRPLVPNSSPRNRARNRRVEIVLLPPDLPTVTEEIK